MKKRNKIFVYIFVIIIIGLLIFEIGSFVFSVRARNWLSVWAEAQGYIEREKHSGY